MKITFGLLKEQFSAALLSTGPATFLVALSSQPVFDVSNYILIRGDAELHNALVTGTLDIVEAVKELKAKHKSKGKDSKGKKRAIQRGQEDVE